MMKIDKIIFSVDDNPMYLGFWKFISKWTKERLGVTPVLFHITDEETDFYEDDFGIVKKFKSLPEFTSSFQCRMIRMWGTRYFMDEFCMTGDIDMMMINKEYFHRDLHLYDENSLVIYGSDAYDKNRFECINEYALDRYPICYNLAKGSVFEKILGTYESFEDYCKITSKHHYLIDHCDELYFGHRVNNFEHGVNVIKLKRGFRSCFICPNRLERPLFLSKDEQLQLKNKEIIDVHLIRPYELYETQINILKELIV
jgi:hypothetical protein